jgi:hypothetical protein
MSEVAVVAKAKTPASKKKSPAKKPAAKKPSAKSPAAKAKRSSASKKKDAAVEVERRDDDRRNANDRRTKSEPVAVERRKLERREKVNRRRQIDPTTCERDYSPEELEFMSALDTYKRKNGRMFPTCSEILEVIKELGYAKLHGCAAQRVELPASSCEAPTAEDAAFQAASVEADFSTPDA